MERLSMNKIEFGQRHSRFVSAVAVLALLLVVSACGDAASDTNAAPSDDTSAESAASPNDEFPTEDIEVIVPFPGGNFELQTRTFAPLFQEYLPNEIQVGAVNVEGGSGLIGYNQTWNAEPDGYTLAVEGTHGTAIRKLSDENAEWDPAAWHWIGGWFPSTPALGVRADLDLSSWEDFLEYASANEVIFGTPGAGTLNHAQMQVLSQVLGINARFVHYGSTGDVRAALNRGEVDAYVAPSSTIGEFVEAEEAEWIGILIEGEHELYPEVPTLDALDGTGLLDDQESNLLMDMVGDQRGWLTTAEVPADRLEILRTAFWEAVNDERWVEFMANEGIVFQPSRGGELDEFMEDFWPTFQEVWAQLQTDS